MQDKQTAAQAGGIESGEDVVTFLKGQHKEIKALFDKVLVEQGRARQSTFAELVNVLKRHEAGEQATVHPVARTDIPMGQAIVAKHLAQEKQAAEALTELQAMNVDSDEFVSAIHALMDAVIAHAESEEQNEFDVLAEYLDKKRLRVLEKKARSVESDSPDAKHD